MSVIPIGPSFADNQLLHGGIPSAEAPQLTETVGYNAAPWVYAALIGIHHKESTGKYEPGIGDFRVERLTADAARQAVSCVPLADLSAPLVLHMSGGGLSLQWTVQERRIEIDVFPQGDVTLSRFDHDALIDTCDMLEVRDQGLVPLMRKADIKNMFLWLLCGR